MLILKMSTKTTLKVQVEVTVEHSGSINLSNLFSEGDTLKVVKVSEEGNLICERVGAPKVSTRTTQDSIDSQVRNSFYAYNMKEANCTSLF